MLLSSRQARISAGFLATSILFSACSRLALDTNWRSERYVALAVDARSQMDLSFDQRNGSAIGLVGPTVFAIGADSKYIVVKQHPASNQAASAFDRSITNYFVVERTDSPILAERKMRVQGPLQKDEFDRMAAERALPPFTKIFTDLE